MWETAAPVKKTEVGMEKPLNLPGNGEGHFLHYALKNFIYFNISMEL